MAEQTEQEQMESLTRDNAFLTKVVHLLISRMGSNPVIIPNYIFETGREDAIITMSVDSTLRAHKVGFRLLEPEKEQTE